MKMKNKKVKKFSLSFSASEIISQIVKKFLSKNLSHMKNENGFLVQ